MSASEQARQAREKAEGQAMTHDKLIEDAARAICCARHRCEGCLGNGEGGCFDPDLWMPEAAAALADTLAILDRYRKALEDVTDPLGHIKRLADAKGSRLSNLAYAIANDLSFVQGIAKAALTAIK